MLHIMELLVWNVAYYGFHISPEKAQYYQYNSFEDKETCWL